MVWPDPSVVIEGRFFIVAQRDIPRGSSGAIKMGRKGA
jgi:hypothetical protein